MGSDATIVLKSCKEEICKRFKVDSIAVFGSQARGEGGKDSDVDVIVAFGRGGLTFDNYMALKFYMEALFHRNVDLVIRDDLREEIRETVLKEAVYI